MLRFTLPSALSSITCFCIAAATYRLFTTGAAREAAFLLLTVSCVAGMAGFGFLVNEVPFSVFLGLLIVFLLVFPMVVIWR